MNGEKSKKQSFTQWLVSTEADIYCFSFSEDVQYEVLDEVYVKVEVSGTSSEYDMVGWE